MSADVSAHRATVLVHLAERCPDDELVPRVLGPLAGTGDTP